MKTKTVFNKRRRAVWKDVRARRKVDVMLVTKPQDVGYLTGFSGAENGGAYLVLSGRWSILIPGRFYREQAIEECPGLELYNDKPASYAAVAAVIKGRNVRQIGIQSEAVTLSNIRKMRDVFGKKRFVELEGMTHAARMRKEDGEISCVRKAVSIARRAFDRLTAAGAAGIVGRTERDIASELDFRMRELGAKKRSFDTIVASGPHSSRCHHFPTKRRIRAGEPLLIDWGGMVGEYCSDLTRTVFIGRISPQFEEIYLTVRKASRAAIASIRPGVQCGTIDRAARQVIEDAGYGERFHHGLGHGLGREVHEEPYLKSDGRTRLAGGMIVTVEPGIYLPGKGGVRIEDDILVTPDGAGTLAGPASTLDKILLA